ncbi:MAG TPA: hypothetical protein VME23_21925 [Terracidiphilus sp.]|nr:hypothetical protein [Terracidiphilus sp.]
MSSARVFPLKPEPRDRFPRWILAGFWVCIVIAVAAVVVRAIALSVPVRVGGPPGTAELDTYFKAHAGLTWTHILCALGYVLFLPLCFWRRTRSSPLVMRIFFGLGFLVAATAYAINLYAIGGWVERSAILFFNSLFLGELVKALVLRRSGDAAGARVWSTRATAVLLGIATTRPVVGVFFATSLLTHLTPHQFFGYAFWIGFSINTIAIELWLRSRGAAERFLK